MLKADIRIKEPIPIQLRIYDKLDYPALIQGYMAACYGIDACDIISVHRQKFDDVDFRALIFWASNLHDLKNNLIVLVDNKINLQEIRFTPSRKNKPIVVCTTIN